METESGADSTLYGPWSLNGTEPISQAKSLWLKIVR